MVSGWVSNLWNSTLFCHCFDLTAGIVSEPGWYSPLSRIPNTFALLSERKLHLCFLYMKWLRWECSGNVGDSGESWLLEEALFHTLIWTESLHKAEYRQNRYCHIFLMPLPEPPASTRIFSTSLCSDLFWKIWKQLQYLFWTVLKHLSLEGVIASNNFLSFK